MSSLALRLTVGGRTTQHKEAFLGLMELSLPWPASVAEQSGSRADNSAWVRAVMTASATQFSLHESSQFGCLAPKKSLDGIMFFPY